MPSAEYLDSLPLNEMSKRLSKEVIKFVHPHQPQRKKRNKKKEGGGKERRGREGDRELKTTLGKESQRLQNTEASVTFFHG